METAISATKASEPIAISTRRRSNRTRLRGTSASLVLCPGGTGIWSALRSEAASTSSRAINRLANPSGTSTSCSAVFSAASNDGGPPPVLSDSKCGAFAFMNPDQPSHSTFVFPPSDSSALADSCSRHSHPPVPAAAANALSPATAGSSPYPSEPPTAPQSADTTVLRSKTSAAPAETLPATRPALPPAPRGQLDPPAIRCRPLHSLINRCPPPASAAACAHSSKSSSAQPPATMPAPPQPRAADALSGERSGTPAASGPRLPPGSRTGEQRIDTPPHGAPSPAPSDQYRPAWQSARDSPPPVAPPRPSPVLRDRVDPLSLPNIPYFVAYADFLAEFRKISPPLGIFQAATVSPHQTLQLWQGGPART